jgi:Flp pilus assembly pilin Flp
MNLSAATARELFVRLLRDESGSEIVEYAMALAFFGIVAIASLYFIPTVANNQVTTDDNNFSQSIANGY